MPSPPYPCPCCGFLVFAERPGSYDNCPVCGWEDDVSQLRFPTESGANPPLVECQRRFLASPQAGVSQYDRRHAGIWRDEEWRPINLDMDEFEVPMEGVDYGLSYADDLTTLYYWRRSPG